MSEIGHNLPPEPTALEQAREQLADLELEANNWFDGSEIANEAQAAEVSRLLDAARKVRTAFDTARKSEKGPHDQAAKAVDAAWKPLLTGVDRVIECARATTTSWLVQQDRIKRAAEAEARAKAEATAAEARRLAEQNDGTLAAAKARDAAIEEAQKAEARATAASNDKANAKGEGMGRAIGLRTTWRAEVLDRKALLTHIATTRRPDLEAWLEQWAASAVRSGARDLPGVNIWQERVAA